MTAGRKPKPTAIRKLQGNPSKRPINKAEPQSQKKAVMPEWLSEAAKSQWSVMSPKLEAAGLLTDLDEATLALYCEAFSRFRQASDALTREGTVTKAANGMLMQSPWLAIANKAHDQMVKLLIEFGMSPSSRSRVTVQQPEEVNPFAIFG